MARKHSEGGGALGTARTAEGGEGKGGQTTVRVRVVDWEQPANSDFLLVSQFSVTGALYLPAGFGRLRHRPARRCSLTTLSSFVRTERTAASARSRQIGNGSAIQQTDCLRHVAFSFSRTPAQMPN